MTRNLGDARRKMFGPWCRAGGAQIPVELLNQGDLKGFRFQQEEWEIDEHFYDWLYLNALIQNEEIAEEIIKYGAFTDIEFNPEKSFNCQAYAAALFKAATIRGMDLSETKIPSKFKELFPKEKLIDSQLDLF